MQALPCIFCDIIAGMSPSSVVHSDSQCLAFMDKAIQQ
jgi:diadenosine tetraphosphate (Ap4A) HIT family hydrolase